MVEITDNGIQPRFRSSDDRNSGGIYSTRLKRVFDVSVVLIVSPFVLLVVAICAFLVRRDGGPAFYGQERVGQNGRIFRCWKLRSMVVDAEAQLQAHLDADPEARLEWERTQKLKRDPRITRIGALIRKTSIDELPQLWNVLVGDMSLVGPRPMMPSQMAMYPGEAYYRMRPGITGIWQVSDRNNSAFAARADHDTTYADQVSLRTDIWLLAATVPAVIRGTGY